MVNNNRIWRVFKIIPYISLNGVVEIRKGSIFSGLLGKVCPRNCIRVYSRILSL